MNCEMLTSPQSSSTNTSPESISILVIDDDFACLAVVSRMLEGCNYGVCAIRRAIEALSILREREGSIDLVLTDVHMPEMDGFELLARIKEEFEVPVVMMSGDDYEDIMLRALENGAVYYILKPVTVDDLKDLWQFAFVPNNENAVAIEQMGSVRAESTTAAGNVSEENLECESSVNEESSMQEDSNKRASKGKDICKGKDKDDSSNAKKRRVIWTNELHNKFLEAIDQLGLKKISFILEKIQEASQCIEPSFARTLAGGFLRSSFALSDPSFMLSTHLRLPQFPELQHSQTVNQQGFGSSIQNLSASVPMASTGRPINYLASTSNPAAQLIYSQSLLVSNQGNLQQSFGTAGTPSYLNQGASTSNSTAQPRYSQLFPVSNQGNTQQSFGAAATFNLRSDANNTVFGMEPHHVQMASLLNGDTSRGLMRNRDTMQMINQQPQARVGTFANGPLNNFNNMLGFHAQNTFTLGNMGSHGSSNQLQNFNYSNTNYAGIQMGSTGNLSGLGRMGSVVGESSHGIDYNNNLLDEIFGGNMPPKAGGNSGYTIQGESSSGGYGSANQFPPSFTNSVNRQQTPPPPPSLQQQECNSFGTGGGDESLFELIKSSYTFGNSRLAKSFDDIDFTNITFSQTNETMDQQDDDEVMDPKLGIGDYEVEDSPPEQP